MHPALIWCASALALLGHGFLWTGAVNRLHGLKGPRTVVKLLSAICVTMFLALPVAIAWKWISATLPANPFEAEDWTRAYAWLCAGIGAASLVVKPWVEWRRHDWVTLVKWTAEPRDVVKALGAKPLTGPVARVLGSVPGNQVLSLSVDRKQLALAGLPAELDGLTIAHLSDLHMTGRVGCEYFAYVSRTVNDLRPDVIAITGDVVENEACWPWLAESLGKLCAPLGVYFILGNHDRYIDESRTRAILIDAGLTCLSGRWLRAQWNGAPVLLGGNELPWLPPAANLAQLPPRREEGGDFRMALCHTPDQFMWCQRANVDLALAGHMHGGQVRLPLLGSIGGPSLYGTRYACGVFRRGRTVLHVTRGVGGETPLRWRCPPEVALLELTPRP